MEFDKITQSASTAAVAESQVYGVLSRSFLITCVAVSLIFLITHGLIHSVKLDFLSIEQLEAMFFPGVYWSLAASCISLLAVSALLISLTVAIAISRACFHAAPCRLYWLVLLVQVVPWGYFFLSTS